MSESPDDSRRRRGSMELPPDLSEYLQLYSSQQDLLNHEASMRQALTEFNDILNELNEPDENEDVREKDTITNQIKWGALGLCTVAAGVAAAPFTGGTSMAVATAAATTAGAVTVGGSAVSIIDILLYKKKIETIAEKVEALVKKFLKIVEQLKKDLVKIKSLSEKLQESTVINLATVTLNKVEEVQKVLEQLSESEKISELLQGGDFVGSVRELNSQSEEVLTKLEELRSAVKGF